MRIPLKYQSTESDCVPTTFLNALSYLFDREEIPPEVIQRVLLYSLDTINSNGELGKGGTTDLACQFVSQWLERYSSKNKKFSLKCEHLIEDEVRFDPYYRRQQFRNSDIHFLKWVKGKWDYNLKVSRQRLESIEYEKYSFGPIEERSCCLMMRT